MRIGMLLDKSFPPDNRVENEAVSLIEQGHDLYLYCLNFNSQKTRENIRGINVFRHSFRKVFFKKFSPLAYTIPIYHKLLKRSISKFVEKHDFDVLHVHDMEIAGLVLQLNRKWKLPLVLDLHENKPEIMKTYSQINSGPGKYLVNINKWKKKQNEFISSADRIIVVTEEAKADIIAQLKIDPPKITVVPNTVKLDLFLKYPPVEEIIEKYKENFTLLYLGATGIRRGLKTAIKAVEILKEKISNVNLVIVGNSRDDDLLKEFTEELGLEKQVEFCGWQDVKKFPSYIIASDICLSPLTRNIHHDTTFANKIFQYMVMGRAVVVSDCTAQKNLVDEVGCGLIHQADNAADLAEKVLELYRDERKRKKMGKLASNAVFKKYNWQVTSQGLINLYDDLSANS